MNKFLCKHWILSNLSFEIQSRTFHMAGAFFPMAKTADRLNVQYTSNIVVVVLVVLESLGHLKQWEIFSSFQSSWKATSFPGSLSPRPPEREKRGLWGAGRERPWERGWLERNPWIVTRFEAITCDSSANALLLPYETNRNWSARKKEIKGCVFI